MEVTEPWCTPDGCPASICGGPHTEVITGPGVAVIAPVGTDPELMAQYGARLTLTR
jgi:hypothetical protein